MTRKSNEVRVDVRENMRGGNGKVTLLHSFNEAEIESKVRVCARIDLGPGCSIGEHDHTGEDEIYYIICGTGKVSDNGTDVIVTAGDAVLTGKGEVHSIENVGKDLLSLVAVVIKY